MAKTSGPNRYLLVTHIPFVRVDASTASVDGLWARDLQGLAGSVGPVRVAAPQLAPGDVHLTWGPTVTTLSLRDDLQFVGFPPIRSRRDFWRRFAVRQTLRREVEWADLVHTSNLYPPYLGLSYAHDLAVSKGTKTLFVVAEDFRDVLAWEWIRESTGRLQRFRRERLLAAIDGRVARSARTASLTFLHTPAAVARYRLEARNGIAIRQTGHEAEDVIAQADLDQRCARMQAGEPLVVIAVSRLQPLKGIDFLIAAIALLGAQGVAIEARIYGQGDAAETWKSLAGRLGVADRVHFGGGLEPGPAVYRAISRGDLFAMPHRTTDFGRAFFDAMAGGVPVVAFRNPASIDTVRDGTDGFLSPQDDVEGLAAVLRRLHGDRVLLARAAYAARERALTNTRSQWFNLRAGWIRGLFDE